MQVRNKENELYHDAEKLLKELKCNETVNTLVKAIELYSDTKEFSADDCRLLGRLHFTVAEACLISTVTQHPVHDIDISFHYDQAIAYLKAIDQKSNKDYFDLGVANFKLAVLQSLLKAYDTAIVLYTTAMEAFINGSQFEAALNAGKELQKIIPLATKKYTGFKISFLQDIPSGEQNRVASENDSPGSSPAVPRNV